VAEAAEEEEEELLQELEKRSWSWSQEERVQ